MMLMTMKMMIMIIKNNKIKKLIKINNMKIMNKMLIIPLLLKLNKLLQNSFQMFQVKQSMDYGVVLKKKIEESFIKKQKL